MQVVFLLRDGLVADPSFKTTTVHYEESLWSFDWGALIRLHRCSQICCQRPYSALPALTVAVSCALLRSTLLNCTCVKVSLWTGMAHLRLHPFPRLSPTHPPTPAINSIRDITAVCEKTRPKKPAFVS